MARSMIIISGGGFQDWIDEIDKAADEMPEIMLGALKARQQVIEDAVREQYVSLGGSQGGFIYQSVGQSSAYSKQNPVDVVGTVGVYDMDSVKVAFGKTEKDLNAAQLAYWIENGTSRLRMGGRKKKGVEYPDEMLITIQPKPFITTAVYSSWDQAEKAFNETFNRLYEQKVKR